MELLSLAPNCVCIPTSQVTSLLHSGAGDRARHRDAESDASRYALTHHSAPVQRYRVEASLQLLGMIDAWRGFSRSQVTYSLSSPRRARAGTQDHRSV